MKLSDQDNKFLQFLIPKKEVYWEELAHLCKHPSSVKLKTVKKVVSDLKKKFKDENLPVPFSCSFSELTKTQEAKTSKMIATECTTEFNGQKLVQIKRTTDDNTKSLPKQITTIASLAKSVDIVDCKNTIPEFAIISTTRQIRTRSGNYNLNYEEFDLFSYLLNNRGKFISLEEMRDKVCFPKFGSKLPARWFSAIQRRISNIRHQIPETRDKLLTARQQHYTGYIFN